MAKRKRKAVRKPTRNPFLENEPTPPIGSYRNPLISQKPISVSDVLEIVEAAGHTLRTMRLRITQLEIENQKLQNLVDKASFH